jgi:hypothetical protein
LVILYDEAPDTEQSFPRAPVPDIRLRQEPCGFFYLSERPEATKERVRCCNEGAFAVQN